MGFTPQQRFLRPLAARVSRDYVKSAYLSCHFDSMNLAASSGTRSLRFAGSSVVASTVTSAMFNATESLSYLTAAKGCKEWLDIFDLHIQLNFLWYVKHLTDNLNAPCSISELFANTLIQLCFMSQWHESTLHAECQKCATVQGRWAINVCRKFFIA